MKGNFTHYRQGSPRSVPIERRFWKYVEQSGECWVWTGALATGGYGVTTVDGRMARAHRVSYEMANGPVPAGLELDHLCRNRRCVRPDHLEAVTHIENVRRSPIHSMAKTACPQGHPYSGVSKAGRRICHTCGRDKQRRFRAKAVAA